MTTFMVYGNGVRIGKVRADSPLDAVSVHARAALPADIVLSAAKFVRIATRRPRK